MRTKEQIVKCLEVLAEQLTYKTIREDWMLHPLCGEKQPDMWESMCWSMLLIHQQVIEGLIDSQQKSGVKFIDEECAKMAMDAAMGLIGRKAEK